MLTCTFNIQAAGAHDSRKQPTANLHACRSNADHAVENPDPAALIWLRTLQTCDRQVRSVCQLCSCGGVWVKGLRAAEHALSLTGHLLSSSSTMCFEFLSPVTTRRPHPSPRACFQSTATASSSPPRSCQVTPCEALVTARNHSGFSGLL